MDVKPMKVDRVENVVLVALVVALDNLGVELAVFDGLGAGLEKMQLGRFLHFLWNVFHCQ